MKKLILLLLGTLIFTSCSNINTNVDAKTYHAENYGERVKFIIVHYTAINTERSIRALTEGQVSSHYLITENKRDPIYQLVPLDKRAWHAGISEFSGRTSLNDTSIGIEIVNMGYKLIDKNLKTKDITKKIVNREFYPYEDFQIKKIAKLLQELVEEYGIPPKHLLGHSDVSPTRKQDPGPLFPWKQLYDEYGLGAWYNRSDYITFYDEKLYKKYNVADIQKEFRKYGYGVKISGKMDDETIKVIGSFQAHFRQNKVTGKMDLETFAILKALNKKYS